MKEGTEKNEEKIVNKLLEEAADLFFSKIEPKQKKGEINDSAASNILESLAEADEMPDNNPEKLNIIEHQINNMKRILEQGTHSEQNKAYGYIPDKKEFSENVTVADTKVEENEKEGEGVPLPYTDYSKTEDVLEGEISETSESEIETFDENLLNFRKDIKEALEDLSYEREELLDEISKINKTLDSLVHEDILNNEAEYGRLINKRTFLSEELENLNKKISFYELLEKSNEPEKEINEAFSGNIIEESEKDELLYLLNPEYAPEEEEEIIPVASVVHEEKDEPREEATQEELLVNKVNRIIEQMMRKSYLLKEKGEISEEDFTTRKDILFSFELLGSGYFEKLDKAYYEDAIFDTEEYNTLKELEKEIIENEQRIFKEIKEENKPSFYQELAQRAKEETEIEDFEREFKKVQKKNRKKTGSKSKHEDKEEKKEKALIEDLINNHPLGPVYKKIEEDYTYGIIENRYFIHTPDILTEIVFSEDYAKKIHEEIKNIGFAAADWLLKFMKRYRKIQEIESLLNAAYVKKNIAIEILEDLKSHKLTGKRNRADEEVMYSLPEILDFLKESRRHKEAAEREREELESPRKEKAVEAISIIPSESKKEEKEAFKSKRLSDLNLKSKFNFKSIIDALTDKWTKLYYEGDLSEEEFFDKKAFIKSIIKKINNNGDFRRINEMVQEAYYEGTLDEEDKNFINNSLNNENKNGEKK